MVIYEDQFVSGKIEVFQNVVIRLPWECGSTVDPTNMIIHKDFESVQQSLKYTNVYDQLTYQ